MAAVPRSVILPNFRRKSMSPFVSSPFRSPLLKSLPEKNASPETKNMSLEELKASTKELWEKNKELSVRKKKLEKKGYKEEQVQWYIDKFHEYNQIKDIAQNAMGRLAILDEVTIKAVHEEFGMTEND